MRTVVKLAAEMELEWEVDWEHANGGVFFKRGEDEISVFHAADEDEEHLMWEEVWRVQHWRKSVLQYEDIFPSRRYALNFAGYLCRKILAAHSS